MQEAPGLSAEPISTRLASCLAGPLAASASDCKARASSRASLAANWGQDRLPGAKTN